MAEKITPRKEYRGLGYAPAVSVPGLVQTRPIGSPAPAQTNELLKLAKNLENFGDAFTSSALLQADINNKRAERLAKEDFVAWQNSYPGHAFREPVGSQDALKPGFMMTFGKEGRIAVPDRRAQILNISGDDGLSDAITRGVIRPEATPAYIGYLKREAAKSIVSSKYSKLLERKINEAALFDPQNIDLEARTRDFMQSVDQELQQAYGEKWHIWAPEEVAEARDQFIRSVESKHFDNRQQFENKTYVENLKNSFFDADSKDKFLENIQRLARLGQERGLDVTKLTGEAAISAVTELITKGFPEAARTLSERVQDAELSGVGFILDSKVQDQLEVLIENAERDQIKFNAQDKAKATEYIERRFAEEARRLGRDMTKEEVSAFAIRLSKETLDTGRKIQGQDGEPINLVIDIENIDRGNKSFAWEAVAVIGTDYLATSKVLGHKDLNVSRALEEMISNGSFNEARNLLEQNREVLSAQSAAVFHRKIQVGQQLTKLSDHETYKELKGLALTALQKSMGIDSTSDATASQQSELVVELGGMMNRILKETKAEMSQWLSQEANRQAGDDARHDRADEIFREKFEAIKGEVTAKPRNKDLFDTLRSEEAARRGQNLEEKGTWKDFWFDQKTPESRRKTTGDEMDALLNNPLLKELRTEGATFRSTVNKARAAAPGAVDTLVARHLQLVNKHREIKRDAQLSAGKAGRKLLGAESAEDRKEILMDITKARQVAGFSAQEIATGRVQLLVNYTEEEAKGRGVSVDDVYAHPGSTLNLQDLMKNPTAAADDPLINPFQVPLFVDMTELKRITNEDGHPTLKSMLKNLGIQDDPEGVARKNLLNAQVLLLRRLGRSIH